MDEVLDEHHSRLIDISGSQKNSLFKDVEEDIKALLNAIVEVSSKDCFCVHKLSYLLFLLYCNYSRNNLYLPLENNDKTFVITKKHCFQYILKNFKCFAVFFKPNSPKA